MENVEYPEWQPRMDDVIDEEAKAEQLTMGNDVVVPEEMAEASQVV
jgi:hypothetical protein